MKFKNISEEYTYEVVWLNGYKEKGKVYKDEKDNWNVHNYGGKKSSKYNGNRNKNKK